MHNRILQALNLTAAIAGALLAVQSKASAGETFVATGAVTLPQGQIINTFDISYVNPQLGIYLLADRTNKSIDVVDTATNDLVKQLQPGFVGVSPAGGGSSGPNGVLMVNNREVWAGDGNSTVKVINLQSGKLLDTISTGGSFRSDELCDDPRHHIVAIANGDDTPYPFITLISTETHRVLKRITMDGTEGAPKATNGIESCQWSRRTGMFYVNIPEVNGPGNNTAPGAVVVVSPETLRIERVFNIPLANCGGPTGMAIGPDPQILLGCASPGTSGQNPSAVIDERNGDILATVPNEAGDDEVCYDEGDDRYFLADSDSLTSIPVLGVINARTLTAGPSTPTGAGKFLSGTGRTHSVAADPVLNQIYVPVPNTAIDKVCSSAGGNDAQGCIAVFTAVHGGDSNWNGNW